MFTTINKGPVQSPINQNVFFDLNPVIDLSQVEKRPTWVSSSISCAVDQASDGLTCTIKPNTNFTGQADIVCDVWLKTGNQERYWWQLRVGGNMNPTVTTVPR